MGYVWGMATETLIVEGVDNGYSPDGRAVVVRGVCAKCGTEGPVLSADASRGEYRTVDLCLPCIQDGFRRAEASAQSETWPAEWPGEDVEIAGQKGKMIFGGEEPAPKEAE